MAREIIEDPAPLSPRAFPFRVLPFPFYDLQAFADLTPVTATSDEPAPPVPPPVE
jgi:hypothetical protein